MTIPLVITCIKCGRNDISIDYHKFGTDTPGCSLDYDPGNVSEHLHYTCRTCGYDWTGPTADAPGEKRPGGFRRAAGVLRGLVPDSEMPEEEAP